MKKHVSFYAFEMKGLRKILPAGFMDSKENKWVGSKQSWSKEATDRHCQSKEASILWSHHEETRELPGKRDNARNNARCMQLRKITPGLMKNIKMWTGLPTEKSIKMTEDRDKWRKYVHGVANPRIEDGQRTEHTMYIGPLTLRYCRQLIAGT